MSIQRVLGQSLDFTVHPILGRHALMSDRSVHDWCICSSDMNILQSTDHLVDHSGYGSLANFKYFQAMIP